MRRQAFKMKLFPGFADEYKKRHEMLWPELGKLLHQKGISDYSIFLDETSGDLFGVMSVEEPSSLEDLPNHPIMQKWWHFMKDIMETNPDNSPVTVELQEVFILNESSSLI